MVKRDFIHKNWSNGQPWSSPKKISDGAFHGLIGLGPYVSWFDHGLILHILGVQPPGLPNVIQCRSAGFDPT